MGWGAVGIIRTEGRGHGVKGGEKRAPADPRLSCFVTESPPGWQTVAGRRQMGGRGCQSAGIGRERRINRLYSPEQPAYTDKQAAQDKPARGYFAPTLGDVARVNSGVWSPLAGLSLTSDPGQLGTSEVRLWTAALQAAGSSS
ncbi:hypothetical protein DPEC_G00347450 [Dallia pectoralis]|uniref:Uncharacterized protein n=1 Tax=Dallia pectoralis TaxID=75939 RepID=A0ACC2F4G0_DALPE|nr:hypothetical protein DPEC_G00347450 [Dallia pectoralis]